MKIKSSFRSKHPRQWTELVNRDSKYNEFLLDFISQTEQTFVDLESTYFTIDTLNEELMDKMRYVVDPDKQDTWGNFRIEKGMFSGREIFVGDCDDYAVEILYMLWKQGIPTSAMRLCICAVRRACWRDSGS